MKRILFIFGTRPEAIKMAPLIKEFCRHPDVFKVGVCVTAQHRQMLDQILDFFSILPDYDLNVMAPNQSLFSITERILKGLEPVFDHFSPDLVFVQGDTTTAMVGALAAFYKEVRVAHLEAGLRSGDRYSPFPEEVNRKIVAQIAGYHFAPTPGAMKNLTSEQVTDGVYMVGNTVIDALLLGMPLVRADEQKYAAYFNFLDFQRRIILVTGHRRESFGGPFEQMCLALSDIVEANDDVQIVYPVHLNPNVQEPVRRILSGIDRVKLIDPLDYPYLLWLMSHSYLVLTDSGGIQEEAPALGIPVIVMRDVTERQEGIDAGTALLAGTSRVRIAEQTNLLLKDRARYEQMSKTINPYGDGSSSSRIVRIVSDLIGETGAR